jgi:hypothetical protein
MRNTLINKVCKVQLQFKVETPAKTLNEIIVKKNSKVCMKMQSDVTNVNLIYIVLALIPNVHLNLI